MNQNVAAQLYLLFALLLLVLGWKICQNAGDQLRKIEQAQHANVERLLTEN
jgi:hypothetical protein